MDYTDIMVVTSLVVILVIIVLNSLLTAHKKPKERKIITLEKVYATFTTVDGVKHQSGNYRWIKASSLTCSVSEYIMDKYDEQMYFYDENNVMYLFHNIVSIEWNLVDKKQVYYDNPDDYKMSFSNDEVSKLEEVIES